jgi:hypothetical protein
MTRMTISFTSRSSVLLTVTKKDDFFTLCGRARAHACVCACTQFNFSLHDVEFRLVQAMLI